MVDRRQERGIGQPFQLTSLHEGVNSFEVLSLGTGDSFIARGERGAVTVLVLDVGADGYNILVDGTNRKGESFANPYYLRHDRA